MLIVLIGAALATGQAVAAAGTGQTGAGPQACGHAINTKGTGASGNRVLSVRGTMTSGQAQPAAAEADAPDSQGTGAQRTEMAIKTKVTGAQRGAGGHTGAGGNCGEHAK